MKRCWDLKPNLVDCILEERIAPAIANLGVIALTTSGFALVTPFPGASNSAAGSLGSGGGSQSTAASVSGAAMPTSFYITGTRGISSFIPGNFTGNPSIGGAATGSSAGVNLTIQVGSGADDASASGSTSSAASRTNPADGGTTVPLLAHIGQVSSSSNSSVLPAGQSTQTQTAPVPSLPPLGVVIPGSPSGSMPGASTPMNPMAPQMGAPTMMPGLGRLAPTLPGGLGVQTSLFPPGQGGN